MNDIKKLPKSRRGKKCNRFCTICFKEFEVLFSDLNLGKIKGLYCSRKCSNKGYPRGVAINKIAWNKGLKLGEHPSIEKYAQKIRGINNGMNGKISPRKGKEHTEEAKRKMSEKRVGVLIGDKNPNWKGGKTTENNKIRTSKKYYEWRKSVLERDGYLCAICRQVPYPIHVDHIKPFALFPELRLDIKNGRTLCVECHRKTDTYGIKALLYENKSK